MYEVFEHTADLGLRIWAPELTELFAEAARALFSIIVENPDAVRPLQEREFAIEGEELDYLLFDWLNELLYTFDTKHILFVEFDIEMVEHGIRARVRGEPIDHKRHHLEHEVKAITYHGLKVERAGDRWMAEVIVDI